MVSAAVPCPVVGKAARQQGKQERRGPPKARSTSPKRRGQWRSSLAPLPEGDEESDDESQESRSSSHGSSRASGDTFQSSSRVLSASALMRRLKQQSRPFKLSFLRL
mmetsp:Transcript_7084/g.16758  ORF Transcript_7084/g.16758 Transcript_7084/m.16758 type:complete len:107 (+) Transcript_7084:59-379(+)